MNVVPVAKRSYRVRLVILLAIVVLLGLAAAALVFLRGLGLRDFARNKLDTVKAVAASQSVRELSQGEYRNVVFLHHSVGNNLIEQGDVAQLFGDAGYSFYDQGYNNMGLRGPDGSDAGFSYPVPNDNTDPDGLAVVFKQKVRSWPVNTLSGLLQHEVIVVKSCFPNSNIGSQESLRALKEIYLGMRETMQKHPDKLFIVFTTPPLNPAETNAENAKRAREMAVWMMSTEFTGGSQNIAVFDFYTLLAENDPKASDANMLNAAFRDGTDSHPNRTANQQIAPVFVEFVTNAAETFKDSR